MNESVDRDITKEIIIYKENDGIVYGYLNQKALDVALYNRAKERTHNFEDKKKREDEKEKRAVQLEDISIQKHTILFRPVSDGDYISKGEVILDMGLNYQSYRSYFRENNISEYDTWLCYGIKVFSDYSGYFLNKITDETIGNGNLGNTIKDDDLLFTIKLAEKPKEAETAIKTFSFSLNLLGKGIIEKLPYLSIAEKADVEQWFVPNYSYVEKDTEVLVLSASDKFTNYGSKVIKTPYSGLLVHGRPKPIDKNVQWTMFRVYPDESYLFNDYLLNDFKYMFDVSKDDFNDTCIVKCKVKQSNNYFYTRNGEGFTDYGVEMSNFVYNGFYFNFEYIGGIFYLKIYNDGINFDKYCTLHLRMSNGNIITLSPSVKPVMNGGMRMCKYKLDKADIDNLKDAKLIKWRFINRDGIPLIEKYNHCLKESEDPTDITQRLSYLGFQKFFNDFLKTVEENAPKEELEEVKNHSSIGSQQSCYVYLMLDTTNNFHKIGISNHPKYREYTLQSEKPTIELLCAKEYPTRIIAEAIESALHKAFANKRIRGEWFNLDAFDIENIKQTLK